MLDRGKLRALQVCVLMCVGRTQRTRQVYVCMFERGKHRTLQMYVCMCW